MIVKPMTHETTRAKRKAVSVAFHLMPSKMREAPSRMQCIIPCLHSQARFLAICIRKHGRNQGDPRHDDALRLAPYTRTRTTSSVQYKTKAL